MHMLSKIRFITDTWESLGNLTGILCFPSLMSSSLMPGFNYVMYEILFMYLLLDV